jgi:GT2 family glycosyltransferase
MARRMSIDGSHPIMFFHWCVEALAYETREDNSRYREWLTRVEAPRRRVALRKSPQQTNVVTEIHIDRPFALAHLRDTATPYVLFRHDAAEASASAVAVLVDEALRSDADVVYADEDEIEGSERRFPYFKPDFSIDLARTEDYVGPVYLVRTAVARRLLSGAGASAAYELLLRLYEERGAVAHVPEVLVHWRGGRNRRLSEEQQERRDEHLVRCYGTDLGQVLAGDSERFALAVAPSDGPVVSIIIPTRDRIDLLTTCLDSIYASRPQVSFEIVVLDNRSQLAESAAWFENAPQRYPGLNVVRADYEFNWSKLNNQGIASSTGRVLLFLNNDIEVVHTKWLERLSAQALRPDVGAVGAMLLYPDGTIQHAGVVLGIGGFADHVYSGTPVNTMDRHAFIHPALSRNVSVCTGACLAIERSKLEKVSGFDEALSIVGDVAVCVRLLETGLLVVYDAGVRLTHYESATRSRAPLPDQEIEAAMRICAHHIERGDAYFNRNLSLQTRYPTLAI